MYTYINMSSTPCSSADGVIIGDVGVLVLKLEEHATVPQLLTITSHVSIMLSNGLPGIKLLRDGLPGKLHQAPAEGIGHAAPSRLLQQVMLIWMFKQLQS